MSQPGKLCFALCLHRHVDSAGVICGNELSPLCYHLMLYDFFCSELGDWIVFVFKSRIKPLIFFFFFFTRLPFCSCLLEKQPGVDFVEILFQDEIYHVVSLEFSSF